MHIRKVNVIKIREVNIIEEKYKPFNVTPTITIKEVHGQPAVLKLITKKPSDPSSDIKKFKEFKARCFKSSCLTILLLKILVNPSKISICHSILIKSIVVNQKVTKIK